MRETTGPAYWKRTAIVSYLLSSHSFQLESEKHVSYSVYMVRRMSTYHDPLLRSIIDC